MPTPREITPEPIDSRRVVPKAVKRKGKDDCGTPLRRFVTQSPTNPYRFSEAACRCWYCDIWLKRIAVFDHEVLESTEDPRVDTEAPICGEE